MGFLEPLKGPQHRIWVDRLSQIYTERVQGILLRRIKGSTAQRFMNRCPNCKQKAVCHVDFVCNSLEVSHSLKIISIGCILEYPYYSNIQGLVYKPTRMHQRYQIHVYNNSYS